jgi:transposase-like protein
MKATNSQLRNLQGQIAQAQEQPRRVYGAALKRRIVAYAEARQVQGATIRQIATDLGLSRGVLRRWLSHARLRKERGRIPFKRYRQGGKGPKK